MTEILPDQVADLPITKRIEWLDERYMRNSRDDTLRNRLRAILVVGDDRELRPEAYRDPIANETKALLVIGESGAGKSSLIRNALSKLPDFAKSTAETPGNYLYVRVPPESTLKSLGIAMASMTGYTRFADKARAPEIFEVLRHRIAELGISMVWIDEVHHLFRPGPGRDPAGSKLMLKNMMQGDGSAALLMSGIPAAAKALAEDEETYRRCSLLNFRSTRSDSSDVARLSAFTTRCCGVVGLAPPEDEHFGERLLMASGGELGRALALMKEMVRLALLDGVDALDLGRAADHIEDTRIVDDLHPFSGGDWDTLRRTLRETGWA